MTKSILEIESMTEKDIREQCAPDFEVVPVKGFNVFLLEISGSFGYSMIVFGDGQQIKYANDYELHHSYFMKDHTRDDLRRKYLEKAESILFTDDDLAKPLESYFDYERRRKFITELLPLKRDFMSWFYIAGSEDEKKARKAEERKHPVLCECAYGFFADSDADYAEYITKLFLNLMRQQEDVKNNYEYQKSAFRYELGNHEYHINSYQGDWDTLSAFGKIKWHGQGAEARKLYYKELEFTETQIRAFEDARKEFLKAADENDWY